MNDPRITRLLQTSERRGLPMTTAEQFRRRKITEATAGDFAQKNGRQHRGNDTDDRDDLTPAKTQGCPNDTA